MGIYGQNTAFPLHLNTVLYLDHEFRMRSDRDGDGGEEFFDEGFGIFCALNAVYPGERDQLLQIIGQDVRAPMHHRPGLSDLQQRFCGPRADLL